MLEVDTELNSEYSKGTLEFVGKDQYKQANKQTQKTEALLSFGKENTPCQPLHILNSLAQWNSHCHPNIMN